MTGLADQDSSRPVTWETVKSQRDELLRKTRNLKGIATIEKVFGVCETMTRGNLAISISTVAGRCRPEGPEAQSISNNRGLAQLVRMAAAVQASKSQPSQKDVSWEDRVLAQIGDADTRSLVQIALVERRNLIGENSSLRANFKRLKAIEVLTPYLAKVRVDDLELVASLIRAEAPTASRGVLTPEERAACSEFLERGIASEGWVIDPDNGEVRSRASGRPVARPGFISALRKIIALPPLDVDGGAQGCGKASNPCGEATNGR